MCVFIFSCTVTDLLCWMLFVFKCISLNFSSHLNSSFSSDRGLIKKEMEPRKRNKQGDKGQDEGKENESQRIMWDKTENDMKLRKAREEEVSNTQNPRLIKQRVKWNLKKREDGKLNKQKWSYLKNKEEKCGEWRPGQEKRRQRDEPISSEMTKEKRKWEARR